MRFYNSIFIVAVCLVTSGQIIAQEKPLITVNGESRISVTPDRFELNFSLIEQGRNTAKLKIKIDDQTKQIIRQLEKLGIGKKNIETSRLFLRPLLKDKSGRHVELERRNLPSTSGVRVHTNTKSDTNDEFETMEMQREIKVTLEDFAVYDQLIAGLLEVGIKRISQLSYYTSNSKEIYEQALMAAINNAKHKAQLMAKSTDIKLGSVVNIEERSYGGPRMAAMTSRFNSEQVSIPGNTEVTAQVRVQFLIEN